MNNVLDHPNGNININDRKISKLKTINYFKQLDSVMCEEGSRKEVIAIEEQASQ